MMTALARTTAGKVLLGAYIVMAIACAFLPLADHIGYEFAVALTIVAALFSPAVGFAAMRREMAAATIKRPARAAAYAGAFAVAALLVPVAIILLNGVRRPLCDPIQGSVWLILLPAPTAWLSATAGALARLLFRRTLFATLAVIAVELGSVIIVALDAYLGPAAFGMDHFAGYFTSFGRGRLVVPDALLSFRAATVAWGAVMIVAAGAIASTETAVRRMHRSWLVALGLALLIVSVGWGDQLGWRTTDRLLRQELAGVQDVDGVIVHYNRTASDRAIDMLMRDVAYTGAQVRNALGITEAAPVHVWVYTTSAQKSRLVGGGGTPFAKPYRHEVHIPGMLAPLPSLRHELIHAYAAEFAPGPWGASGGLIPNAALIEGLAEAFGIDDGALTLYQDAKAMRDLTIAPDLEAMMSITGFGNQATSRAYAYSGAFVRYLAHRFGVDTVKHIYRSGSLEALGDVKRVIADFEAMIDTVQSTPNTRATAARAHSLPPVTQRTCAREIYAVTDSGLTLAANRRWDDALRMLDHACALQPENPDLIGLKLEVAVRMRPETFAPIQAIAQRLLRHPRLDSDLEAETRRRLGDEHWRRGDIGSARQEFEAARDIPSAPDTRRAIASRLLALEDSARAAILRPLFTMEATEWQSVFRLLDGAHRRPADALIQYMAARQYQSRNAFESAIPLMERAEREGLVDEDLRRENMRSLAVALANRNRCDDADRALQRLKDIGGSNADIATTADWVNRCRFSLARGWAPV